MLDGVHSLMRDRKGAVTTTHAGSVTGAVTLALLLWAGVVAPAIYGNNYARHALSEAQRTLAGSTDRGAFTSNLIVTGALLSDTPCPVLRAPIRAGGLYFCFGGSAGCGTPSHGAWQSFEMPLPARALDAVFASGSPFPVFSAHRTHLPNGCIVPLVDGGYTHNVPLEAASLADARQVLVINASPDDPEYSGARSELGSEGVGLLTRSTSQLVRFGSRLLGFMFARAQELDRSVRGSLLVASLRPRPEGRWAWLLDFTEGTRQRMIDEATRDLEQQRRIGRIESWGFPLATARIGPEDRRPMQPRGWAEEPARVIEAVIQSASARDVIALDMDNTILRGDIGDAMFLKLVVDLKYAGDRDEFWALFANQRAAQELREYWNRFTGRQPPGDPPGKYFEPERWSPEFADYVVLFLRQYEELYRGPAGARRAYPWVVQLMSGVSREAMAEMIAELWKVEMSRAVTPVLIHSRKYGDVEIQGGLRVHEEMRKLVEDLHRRGAHVWIVTASAEWIAHHVADLLDVPRERVLGIRLRPSGTFGQLETPITYREGKAEALRRRGLRPVLAIGDSDTDIEMLMAATHGVVVDRGRIAEDIIRRYRWATQPFDLFRARTLSRTPQN